MKKSVLTVFPFLLFPLLVTEAVAQSKIHSPAEILKIMNESKLTYELDVDYKPSDSTLADTPVLSNQLAVKEDKNGNLTLEMYSLSKDANELLATAEAAFQDGKLQQARMLYSRLYDIDPNYHHALTLIGDTYYAEGKYDSAKSFFLNAINRNFADYNAWWFLSDTYSKLGMSDSALHCITVAHLLNVNHQNLRKALRKHRKEADLDWKEWVLVPQFSLSQQGNSYKISSTQEWLTYAMVKALWKFEPGYFEQMRGRPRSPSDLTSTLEEKEALLAYIAGAERKDLANIIEEGYADELVLYELISRRAPSTLLILPRATFFRVAEYVQKYH